MDINFLESLQQGQEAANSYTQNKKELDTILESVEKNLQEFLDDTSIKVCRSKEVVTDKNKANDLKKSAFKYNLLTMSRLDTSIITGYISVYLSKEVPIADDDNLEIKRSKTLFNYKLGEQIYPLEIKYRDSSFFCSDGEAFIDAIKKLLSEGSTIRILRSF